jgi:hypothetical protein
MLPLPQIVFIAATTMVSIQQQQTTATGAFVRGIVAAAAVAAANVAWVSRRRAEGAIKFKLF